MPDASAMRRDSGLIGPVTIQLDVAVLKGINEKCTRTDYPGRYPGPLWGVNVGLTSAEVAETRKLVESARAKLNDLKARDTRLPRLYELIDEISKKGLAIDFTGQRNYIVEDASAVNVTKGKIPAPGFEAVGGRSVILVPVGMKQIILEEDRIARIEKVVEAFEQRGSYNYGTLASEFGRDIKEAYRFVKEGGIAKRRE